LFASPRSAYAAINETLSDALRLVGVETDSSPGGGPAAAPSLVPCFVDPAPGELLVEGRKIVGSAQVRIGGVILQHGSIMLARSPLLDLLPAPVADLLEGAPAFVNEKAHRDVDEGDLVAAIVTARA